MAAEEVTSEVEVDGDQVIIYTTVPGGDRQWLLLMSYEEALELGQELVKAATGVLE